MLKVLIGDNQKVIGELNIVNTGHKAKVGHFRAGEYLYRIKEPMYNHLEIYHKQEEVWTILVEKVLRAINSDNASFRGSNV